MLIGKLSAMLRAELCKQKDLAIAINKNNNLFFIQIIDLCTYTPLTGVQVSMYKSMT